MKTGKQILEEYNAQSKEIDNMSFKSLEQMIDENTHMVITEAAMTCQYAPGGNRETVAKAIKDMCWLDEIDFDNYAAVQRNRSIVGL